MKKRKIWALILTAFLIVNTFSASAQEMSKQDYLDKSRTQKTTAFILLGGGIAIGLTGAILYGGKGMLSVADCIALGPCEEANYGFETGMMIVGGLATVASIPLFVSSSNNKKKAAELSFKHQPINIPKYARNIPRSVPSITFSIPLN